MELQKFKLLCFALLTFAISGFSENLTLDNQTPYPSSRPKSKIAIQWASSLEEVQKANRDLMYGEKLNPKTLETLSKTGKLQLHIPSSASQFRILVWSHGQGAPDLHTNWVRITPGKVYTLETEDLVPSVLMSGSGC